MNGKRGRENRGDVLTWPLVGTAERRDAPAKLLHISAAAIVSWLWERLGLGGCQNEQLRFEAESILLCKEVDLSNPERVSGCQ